MVCVCSRLCQYLSQFLKLVNSFEANYSIAKALTIPVTKVKRSHRYLSHSTANYIFQRALSTTKIKASTMAPNATNKKQQNPQQNHAQHADQMKPFKERRSFEARKLEVENIRKKFPSKIPVVVERYQREANLPIMDKTKFLVPQELTMLNFAIIIKNRLRIPTNRAFYFVINNQSIASTSKTIAEVYKEHKDEDGFLYMTYASQEMFGRCALSN